MARSRSPPRGRAGGRSCERRRSPSDGRGKAERGRGMRTDRDCSRSWSRGDRGAAGKSSVEAKKPVGVNVNQPVKKLRKEIFAKELGYKDESNPFGDQTLTEKFVWKKKNEYLAAAGLYKKSSKEQDVERIESKVREIHQVKKRRDEREVEKRLLEQQRLEHDKEMHDEEFGEWLDKEEHFHLHNAKVRSLIRIEQGRERPVDLVAKGLAIAEGEEFDEMTILDKPPHQLFNQLGLQDAEDMLTEIENFVKHDAVHKAFWKAMRFVCQDAIENKQREKLGDRDPGGMGGGVAEGVVSDIHDLLSSKTKKELEEMHVEIKQNLQQGAAGMDTQFFEAVAGKIPLFMARAEIEVWHNRASAKSEAFMDAHAPVTDAKKPGEPNNDWDDLPEELPLDDEDLSPVLEPLSSLEVGVPGQCSPVLEPLTAFDPDDLLDPDEDERILTQVRHTLVEAHGGIIGGASSGGLDRSKDDELFNRESSKGLGSGEAAFNAMGQGAGDDFHGEVAVPTKHYEWEDKYKPRKPRFFNRVKTGFEWNKYNQTHYDHDNPPPKVVQGYKFNIFYPDLIDKAKAPTYYLEHSDTSETTTIRFHAGPPYEDVAFKVVNREWNLSHKFGFRVVFDRGVLQLYFNFKRWRYRR